MSYVNALWTNIQLCFYNFIRKLFNRKDYSLMTNGQSSLLWNSVIRYPDFQHHYFGQMSLPDDNKRPFSLFTAGVFGPFFSIPFIFSRPKLNVSCKKGFVQNWVWCYPDFQHHYFGQMSLPDDNKRPFLLFTAGVLVLFLFHSFFQTKI